MRLLTCLKTLGDANVGLIKECEQRDKVTKRQQPLGTKACEIHCCVSGCTSARLVIEAPEQRRRPLASYARNFLQDNSLRHLCLFFMLCVCTRRFDKRMRR